MYPMWMESRQSNIVEVPTSSGFGGAAVVHRDRPFPHVKVQDIKEKKYCINITVTDIIEEEI